MTISTSILSFRTQDQNLWAPGAAIELGINTGDLLIYDPDEFTYDIDVGGSFLGFKGQLYLDTKFGLYAYAEIGEAGRFGGGIDITLNTRHDAVVSGNGENIVFDFDDYEITNAQIDSQGFSVGPKAGLDLVVGFEFGFRNIEYALFGFQDEADEFKIIDIPEKHIELFSVGPGQLELPFDLGYGLELTLRVPSGANTEGSTTGSAIATSEGVSDSPFIELSADLDEMLIQLLKKIPFPPLALVTSVLENTVFATFEFDLNDYIPGIGEGIFGVEATVLDIGATIGAAVSEELSLDFSNGDGLTPDVNITLRSDNGTPGDENDDFNVENIKLGDTDVQVDAPDFDGFGPVSVQAMFDLNRARFSHSIGIDLVGGFTIDLLQAATTGYIGEKLGISIGPLVHVEFPEGGFRVELLNDLYTNSFDVADGAFNTVTDTYEIFYSNTLPVGIDLDKPGVVQELIAYNEQRQINIAAALTAFAPIIVGKTAATFTAGNANDIAGVAQFALWLADRPNAHADMEGFRSQATRDVVLIDVSNQPASELTARYINGGSTFPATGVMTAANATSNDGLTFVSSIPFAFQIDQPGGGGTVTTPERLIYGYNGQFLTTPNSVNIIGGAGNDLLVYWGDETRLLDGRGQTAGSAFGDVLVANFSKSHVNDAIEWDLRTNAVGQSGQSVSLKLSRGPVLFEALADELVKDGYVDDSQFFIGGVSVAAGDVDGQATLTTQVGALAGLTGTFVVRVEVEDNGLGTSAFTLRVVDASGNFLREVGTQFTNKSRSFDQTQVDLVFKDVVLNAGERLQVLGDRGTDPTQNGETASIGSIQVFEQHDVSFLGIESFVLTLSNFADIIFTSTFRDLLLMGGGNDTLVLTADAHSETMSMGDGRDVALAELKTWTQVGGTFLVNANDTVYGGSNADEGIVRNLSNFGAEWSTSIFQTLPNGGSRVVLGPLTSQSDHTALSAMVAELSRLVADPSRFNDSAVLPQTGIPGSFINVRVVEAGTINSVSFTEFEAISFEGSETANDLAFYFGGSYYRGGASLADTFVADFGSYAPIDENAVGVVISGFNATNAALIGAPITSQFSTAPTLFRYSGDAIFAVGSLNRTSEIKGFERLNVIGTASNDLLVGGIWDDSLVGGNGNDILVAGGARNLSLGFTSPIPNTILQDVLRGGAGNDTYYVNGDQRAFIDAGTGGGSDLLIFGAGRVQTAPHGFTVTGLRQTFDFFNQGISDVTYTANSTASALLTALDQFALGQLSRNFSFTDGGFGTVTFGNNLRTNLIGLNETDDLFIYDHGATYIGGERAGDTDTFVADFSAQTFGITLNLEQDVGGVTLENGVLIRGMDRVILRLGTGQDLVTGGLLDDVIYGGAGSDILRGGGSVNGDSLFGGTGADLLAWNGNDGISIINGGTDAGDTPGNALIDRVLISAVDENGDSLVAPGDGFGVQLFINAGGGASDFDPLFLGSITTANTSVDISRLLFVANPIGSPPNNVATIRVYAGDDYVSMTEVEATEVQGSNEEDDLIWYQGGTFYDGGDRTGDRDIFVAVLLDETADISINARSGDDRVPDESVFYDIGNGTTIGNFEQIMVRLGSGEDEVFGGDFDDLMYGGDGDDLLDGGAGNDTVDGGAGEDLLFYTSGNDFIVGGADTDILEMNAIPGGFQQLIGLGFTPSSTTFFADRADMTSIATVKSELAGIFSTETDRTIVSGVFGNQLAYEEVERVIISAEEENDLLLSGTGGGILSGDGGDDVLVGLAGNDLFVGGDGFDRYAVSGNWGHDVIGGEYSGTGEIYFFGWNRAQITMSLAAPGSDDLLMTNTNGDTLLFLDYFRNAANGLAYTFVFNNITANLNLTSLGAVSSGPVTVGEVFFGTDGRDDMLDSTTGADSYFAREGNDLITGSAGPDIISGGLGLDAVIYEAMTVASESAVGVTVDLGTGFGLGGDADGDILISIEDVLGSAARDTLIGSDRRNALAGGLGDDTLTGLKGDDFLSGDGGQDQLFGGDGDDVLRGGTANDTLDGGNNDDYLGGGDGADSMIGGEGNDTAAGANGSDTANLGNGNDSYLIIRTASGLVADAGLDTVDGGIGEDTVELADFMTGSLINLGGEFGGAQSVASNGVTDTASSGPFVTLANLSGFENAVGSNLRDTIIGSSAANKLAGLSGNDLLIGFQGNDTIIGGSGIDQVSYAAEGGGGTVSVDLATGLATDTYGNIDTLSEIEHVIGSNTSGFDDLLGDAGDNIFTGNKGTGVDLMDGRAGSDTVDYSIESDTQNYIPNTTTPSASGVGIVVDLSVAGSFSTPNATDTSGHGDLLVDIENIIGSIREDSIKGSAADNLFVGGDGADTMDGGPGGFDTADYSREVGTLGIIIDDFIPANTRDTFGDVDVLIGMDRIIGTARNDQIIADGSYTRELIGGDGNDGLGLIGATFADNSRLFGGGGNDDLFGGAGADFLFGGTGFNNAFGGDGDDVYLSTGGNDTFAGQGGNDEISFELFASAVIVDLNGTTVQTTDSDSVLFGTPRVLMQYSDVQSATGSAFADRISGDAQDNRLKGGAGSDTVIGGDGADTLDGGAGTDTLDYSAGTQGVRIDLMLAVGNATDGFGNQETVTAFERLIGTAFNDTMTGDAKAQTFVAGAGADSINGGGGFDAYDLSTETGLDFGQFLISFDAVTNTISAFVTDTSGAGDAVINVEHFIGGNSFYDDFFGGDGNETYTGNAGVEVDQIFGGGGTDTVDYSFEAGSAGVIVDLRLIGATPNTPNATDTFGHGDALRDIENVTGTDRGDRIIGGVGANLIIALDGNDSLSGGEGDDTLFGGNGTDTADYSLDSGTQGIFASLQGEYPQALDSFGTRDILKGIENIIGTGFADQMAGDDLANVFTGLGGTDLLDGWVGDDSLDGGADGDTLLGWTGDDSLSGGTGDDVLEGEDDDDLLVGGAGADTLSGGEGRDTASYAGSALGVVVVLVTGAATGSGGDAQGDNLTGIEDLTGSDHADSLSGDDGDNALIGGLGNDTLTGGAGIDTLTGGAGDDTYVTDGLDVLSETGGSGRDLVKSSVSFVLLGGFEDLELTGTAAINGDGTGAANRLVGNSAANTLNGRNGNDTMEGGGGNDIYFVDAGDQIIELANGGTADEVRSAFTHTLADFVEILRLTGTGAINGTGNGQANLLIGNAAANRLVGGGGIDAMQGGLGGDTYVVDADDIVTEALNGGGIDTMESAVTITLARNVENLVLTGNSAVNGTGTREVNHLTGNGADNILNGGGGADTMVGGAGNDRYSVDNAGDVVTEAANGGRDQINSAVTQILGDNIENLVLTGTVAINGTGNAEINRITGNGASNILNGMTGSDSLTGGLGADFFVFSTTLGPTNIDLIADYTVADDRIDLAASVFLGIAAGAMAGSRFTSNLTGAATTTAQRIIYETDTGALFYDRDGTGVIAAVQFATIDPNLVLTSSEFFVF